MKTTNEEIEKLAEEKYPYSQSKENFKCRTYFIVGYTACLETTFSMEDMRKAFNEGLAIGQDELVDSDYTTTEYDIDFNRLIKELNKQ